LHVCRRRRYLNVCSGDFGPVFATRTTVCSASTPVLASVDSGVPERQDVAGFALPSIAAVLNKSDITRQVKSIF